MWHHFNRATANLARPVVTHMARKESESSPSPTAKLDSAAIIKRAQEIERRIAKARQRDAMAKESGYPMGSNGRPVYEDASSEVALADFVAAWTARGQESPYPHSPQTVRAFMDESGQAPLEAAHLNAEDDHGWPLFHSSAGTLRSSNPPHACHVTNEHVRPY